MISHVISSHTKQQRAADLAENKSTIDYTYFCLILRILVIVFFLIYFSLLFIVDGGQVAYHRKAEQDSPKYMGIGHEWFFSER